MQRELKRMISKLITCTGPESSGKSTVANALAAHFNCNLVMEYAREYLYALDAPYQEPDLARISKGQMKRIQEYMKIGGTYLISDTDSLTVYIWAKMKYGRIEPSIQKDMHRSEPALYLLCRPDIPWEPDPLRENPLDRDKIFLEYEALIQKLNIPYSILEGSMEQRMEMAIAHCKKL